MPESNDYRKFIEGQLESLHESLNQQFKNQNETLIRIEAQVLRTNGRITKAEQDIMDIKVKESQHIVNCPQSSRLDKIEDSLADYNFFKRNPKLSLGIIVVSVLIVLFSYIEIKNIYSNGAAIHENGLKIEAKK